MFILGFSAVATQYSITYDNDDCKVNNSRSDFR